MTVNHVPAPTPGETITYRVYPHPSLYFLLTVHANRASFIEETGDTEAFGLFQGVTWKVYDDESEPPEFPEGDRFGHMHLIQGHLCAEIIVHECLHAAFRLFEQASTLDEGRVTEFVSFIMPREEWLCFKHSVICYEVYDALGLTYTTSDGYPSDMGDLPRIEVDASTATQPAS